jgi:hypothetical protein
MYVMYVDESGDCGLENSPTRYFVLSGLVMHELRWRSHLERLIEFRRRMRLRYGLKLREEIHSVRFISRRPGDLARIAKHDRLAILRNLLAEMSQMPDISIINIVVDKQGKGPAYDVFQSAWRALIQRFENTIRNRNFPGPANSDERGMIFPDRTDDAKLTKLLRRMRRYNPIPNQQRIGPGYRDLALDTIIGDPKFRLSHHSYFIQCVDATAYFLSQYHAPNAYVRKQNAKNYFLRLDPVLCKVASTSNPHGIVRL